MSPAQRRRRRKPSATARLRPFWFLFAIVAIALAVLGYLAVTWDGFKVKGIEVTGARSPVSASDVLAAAAIDPARNIWLMHRASIAQRVEQIPLVETADVQRVWPNRVRIDVTLRRPAFRLQTAQRTLTLDAQLRVLRVATAADAALPLLQDLDLTAPAPGSFVTAATPRALRDDDDALVAAGIRPIRLWHDRYAGLSVALHDGILIEFGEEEDLPKKIALIDPMLAHVADRLSTVRALDVRAPNAPVIEYKK